jgi:hypothetical protein
MLPPGLVAQPADRADHHLLRPLHPSAQTSARLMVGSCSCDLVRARDPDPRVDERQHRERFRRSGAGREDLIAALERHRRGASVPQPASGWPRALAAFVAEHARNAGDTLFLLRFSAPSESPSPPLPPVRSVRVGEVVARPDGWLEEMVPVVVGR